MSFSAQAKTKKLEERAKACAFWPLRLLDFVLSSSIYCDVDWKFYSCCKLRKTIHNSSSTVTFFVRTKETPWNKSQSGVLEKRMKTTTMMTRTADLISYSMAFAEFIRKHCTMQWISAVDDMFLSTRILKQYCLVSKKKESQRGALERYYQNVSGVIWDLD